MDSELNRLFPRLLEVFGVASRLGDVLDAARRQRFVGRRRELTSFDDALAGRTPRRVLFVHGQGGIGKTSLLAEFRARAGTAGRIVTQVDGREFDPSPDGMTTAIRLAVDHHDVRQPITRLLAGAVILVDGYEQLTPIDGWLRDELVPALSGDTVVVLARPGTPGRAVAHRRRMAARGGDIPARRPERGLRHGGHRRG